MQILIRSIKAAKNEIQANIKQIKIIIISSYSSDIETVNKKNKLLLTFDDIAANRSNGFNKTHAKKIINFINTINFNKYILYVCCDSGESRSAAIAASILKKYKKSDLSIWNNCNYHPNTFIYKMLCDEMGLKISPLQVKIKKYINNRALKNKIKHNK